MNRWIRLAAWLIPAVAFVTACGSRAATDSTSGNTNWLKFCDKQADCGEGLSCQCNTCQQICTASTDCTIADPGSQCVVPSEATQCDEAPAGIRLCVKKPSTTFDSVGGETGDPETGFTNGSGFGVAYVFNDVLGQDFSSATQIDCSATFHRQGWMESFLASPAESISRRDGTFPIAGAFDHSVIWGYWNGSSAEGNFNGSPVSVNHLRYAMGKVATQVPSGLAVYQQWDATPVAVTEEGDTVSTGGDVDYALLAIDYSTAKVGLELRLTVDVEEPAPLQPITFQTSGGIADLSETEGSLTDKVFTVSVSSGPNELLIRGVIVDEGNAVALSYLGDYVEYDDIAPDAGPSRTRKIFGAVGILKTQ